MAPCGRAEVLSIRKHNKAAMCLMEKIHMLDELCSGISSMSVNQQYILKKVTLSRNTHKASLFTDCLMKTL